MSTVLSILDCFNPDCIGGAARVFYEVNRELLKKGNNVHAICREQSSDIENEKSEDGVIYHKYGDVPGNQLKKINHYKNSLKTIFKGLLSESKPDFILLHSSSAAFGLYDEFKNTDIPIIYYFHSPWNREYEIIADRKFCGIRCPLVSILSLIRKRHEKKYINLASGIITLSKSMQDILLDVHPTVKNTKLLIDPGAADGDNFFPVKDNEERKSIREGFGLDDEDFLIITSRRLVPRTGVDVLIKAFAEVRKRCQENELEKEHRTSNVQVPTSNEENTNERSGDQVSSFEFQVSPKLILTGGGGEADMLKQLTVELGISDDVIFTGHVSEEDLAKYYRCSDLFVMPTKYLEGFGLSTVEAMASGLPVVGTDIGGTPEILKKISDELLIKECSVEAVSDKVQEFVEKDDLDSWREKSVTCFKENFTWEKHVDGLLDFFSSNFIKP